MRSAAPSDWTGEHIRRGLPVRPSMTAHHFFTEPDEISNGVVTLRGDEARHAARVLRVRVGEAISVADNAGRVVDAVVTRTDDVVEAQIRGELRYQRTRPELWLCQALAKGDKLDDVVEKATEIGVARIVPFVAERSVVRWDERKRRHSVERWRSIAKAAAKQSHAPLVATVDEIADDVPAVAAGAGLVIVLHEEEAESVLRSVLPAEPPDSVALVVGPEGGLTDDEVSGLVARDARVAGLGPRILRTETAGLVAASIVAFVYGNLG